MATISTLVVSLQANSAKLVSELAKSKKKVGSWAKDVRVKANAVSKAFVASAVVATGAIIAIVNGHAAEIDRLAKKASALRMDTGDLQKLRYQNELAGVSAESLDKSLSKMLKTVSDGKAGLSTAKRAFEELGLSVDVLASMSTDQQFYVIAEAMKGVESQADRTRIAMDVFGRSGSDLLNTFASDLSSTGAEFDKLGGRITSQQAAMVEAYNDAKTKMGSIWDGFLNQLTVQLAPAMQMFVDYISQSVIEFGGLGKVANSVVSSIATGAGFVADVFYGWTLIFKGVRIGIMKLASVATTAFKWIYSQYADLIHLINKDAPTVAFFDGLADSFAKEADKASNELDAMLTKGRPSVQIDTKIAKIQSDVAKAGRAVTSSNTEANKQNTTATAALTDALKTKDKTSDVSSSGAWEKTFGQTASGEKRELKITQPFRDAARSLKTAIDGQNTRDIARFLERAQQSLDAAARRGGNGLTFGSERTSDIDGMQSVLDRLVNQIDKQPEKVGSIDINVTADGKSLTGKLMGEPAFLKQLKQFVDNSTKETARAVAR